MTATETIHEIECRISAASKNLLSVPANACRGQIYKTGGPRVQYFFAYDGHRLPPIDIYHPAKLKLRTGFKRKPGPSRYDLSSARVSWVSAIRVYPGQSLRSLRKISVSDLPNCVSR